MNILGITFGSHSCGLSLLKDGQVIFAVEEERFVRVIVVLPVRYLANLYSIAIILEPTM